MIQNVSRNKNLFREYYGTAIIKTIFFGSIFISLVIVIMSFFPLSNISIYSVFCLAVANLIFLKLSDVAKHAFISMGLLKYTARIIALFSVNRFVASLVLIGLFPHPSLFIWSILYCLATLLTALIGSILVIKTIGSPQFVLSNINQKLGQGFAFSIGTSAQNIYNDLDKSMLAKLATTRAAGIYGAAYHILSVAFMPVQSIMVASFRDFFQQGATGIKSSFNFCKKLLPLSLGYSLLAIVGLLIFAPLLPKIIGDKYSDSVVALMWLSPIVFLRTMHFFAANILTGADYQSTRSTIQVIIAALNGILNFWLISSYQWQGAICATIISELLLMVLLWGSVYIYSQRSSLDFFGKSGNRQ